ncbi:hypothetical protein Bca101_066006 [Brassica carinata]
MTVDCCSIGTLARLIIYYQCHVVSDRSYTFKGPLLEPAETHLHKVLGDDNVLRVIFEDLQKKSSTCHIVDNDGEWYK